MAPLLNNLVALTAIAASVSGVQGKTTYLSPKNPIRLPASSSAKEPLKHAGANGPYFSGPNVNNISANVPANCVVDRLSMVSRHGSRYPDSGAYSGWVDMQTRFSAGNYTATGALSFMPTWTTVLKNSAEQIAMESVTGWKEAYDLGHSLRTRYPDLYEDGTDFYTFANNYTRVIQTARNFARGFLGPRAEELGNVVSVTSKGFSGAIGNSLAPADACPAFTDDQGATEVAEWEAVYVPAIKARLQALITGDLTLTTTDVTQMPYLCGFESQITGRLSPWCSVFTDEELLDYEYFQDLRYWYGIGLGSDLAPKLMTPFLTSMLDVMATENATGIDASGAPFTVPKILTSFLNDGQLSQLVAVSGVFDEQEQLTTTSRDPSRLFVSSHYTCMRGGIAWERMTCRVPTESSTYPNATISTSGTCTAKLDSSNSVEKQYVRIKLNDAVYPVPGCQDGPGKSCGWEDYQEFIAAKYAEQGDWLSNCNVTDTNAPSTVQGASFFTDLTSAWINVSAA